MIRWVLAWNLLIFGGVLGDEKFVKPPVTTLEASLPPEDLENSTRTTPNSTPSPNPNPKTLEDLHDDYAKILDGMIIDEKIEKHPKNILLKNKNHQKQIVIEQTIVEHEKDHEILEASIEVPRIAKNENGEVLEVEPSADSTYNFDDLDNPNQETILNNQKIIPIIPETQKPYEVVTMFSATTTTTQIPSTQKPTIPGRLSDAKTDEKEERSFVMTFCMTILGHPIPPKIDTEDRKIVLPPPRMRRESEAESMDDIRCACEELTEELLGKQLIM
ncbi:unnamed protein product [Caenorhabditis angaria]|uniref:Uncharacterized protein n=1 Tax=Caenorhabditis angaria TaxID=860376 RepID=A0A9P1I996_9PELO|nr:unnamed protein product [Caenorhabditis angaria]